jgi:hypothetical protein
MAVMKKKGGKSLPPISTASLPDVIFMILFFFMISTTMRASDRDRGAEIGEEIARQLHPHRPAYADHAG